MAAPAPSPEPRANSSATAINGASPKQSPPPATGSAAGTAPQTEPFHALLKKKDPLAATILRFNIAPADYVHASFLPETLAGAALNSRIRNSPRARRRISRTLLEASQLTAPPCLDFSTAPRRIALLNPEQLEQLCRLTGAALLWPHLSRVILGAHVRALKAALGSELHTFALQRAPFLIPHAETYPAYWTEQAPAESAALCNDILTILRASGRLCMQDALAAEPPALLGRLRLKLPAFDPWQFPGATAQPEKKALATALLTRLLQRELNLPL